MSLFAENKKEYPTTREGWEKAIRPLKEGYTRDVEAPSMSRKLRSIRNPMFVEDREVGGLPAHECCYRLDERWYLYVRFEKEPVFKVIGFDDFKEEIGGDQFEYVKMIHGSPDLWCEFNPVALIRAVNGLHSLGKKRALLAIRSYDSLYTKDTNRASIYGLDPQRIFLILRLLFVHKDGRREMPAMELGALEIEIYETNDTFPLFPLVVEEGIPFLFMAGYSRIGGSPQNPMKHVEYCEKECDLRKDPILPNSSPIKSLGRLLTSERWNELVKEININEKRWVRWLRRQAVRACRPAYFVPERSLSYMFFPEREWAEHRDRILKSKLEWDCDRQMFVK